VKFLTGAAAVGVVACLVLMLKAASLREPWELREADRAMVDGMLCLLPLAVLIVTRAVERARPHRAPAEAPAESPPENRGIRCLTNGQTRIES
jgi:hypothetical protein